MSIISLGALGIVSEVTLNVVPAYRLHDQTYVAPLTKVIDDLDTLVNETDHFKLWWFPHVDKVVVYRYTRTNKPVNDSRLRQWLMDEFLSVNVYRLLLKLGNVNSNWRIGVNRLLVNGFIKPLNRIEKSYKVFNVPEPPVHREAEWAFDINVAKELLREYTAMINTSNHRINFIQEVRFTKADEYALSPCYKRDTMWLGAYNADNAGWAELMKDFEKLALKYKGRPHWGKEFTVSAKYLQEQYPMLREFNNLRYQFDSEQKLANDYINRLFG
jgi:FAD/FMN-containing dehydrogenase